MCQIVEVAVIYRYVLCGIASLAVHLLVLLVLIEWFNLMAILATTVGFVSAVVVNFTLQSIFVFDSRSAIANSFIKYLFVTTISFSANILLFGIWVSEGMSSPLVAQSIISLLIFLINFFLGKYFVFAYVKRVGDDSNI
mgnify:CR=1 FL=1